MAWYALHTRSRHEFVAEKGLGNKGIEAFVPSAERLRFYRGRRKLVRFPLFPGYLFADVHPDPESYLNVLKTRGIVSFISLEPGRPSSISPDEINSIRRVAGSGTDVAVYPGLEEGKTVRVTRGPFTGAEGIIKKKLDGNYMIVNVAILGRCLGVRIYDDDVEIV